MLCSFILFSNQIFLIFLHLLILYLLLCNNLHHQIICLFNYLLISIFLSLTCCWSLHYLIQNYGTCIDIISFEKLLTNLKLTFYDGMHLQLQHFSDHEFHLRSLNCFFNCWVRCDVKMLLIYILFSCIECILVGVFIITLVESFFEIYCLLFERL